ncbi:hypothetical protein I2486_17560 [Cellulophaga sp. E16_2]|uniref:hypothetical protein n=1 Tax=unclassified Cellulophaga TaxID=2634405 RepID=UPI0013FE4E90|nr:MULTISPECIES: hypothetical protein [unclassified Cellulophaga]MBO0593214.1 hypothetical protein [Cellulophaga sp. E16_2]
MKIKITVISFLLLLFLSFKTIEKTTATSNSIKIEWTQNLEGDFSFNKEWNYLEGIYRNRHGQLSCDGYCPAEIDGMKDKTGKIYKDSLQAFYKIIDTTHIYHSLQSETRMYEYSGTDYITFKRLQNGAIKGKSLDNVSTHSTLKLELQNDLCAATVLFNSIRDLGIHNFHLRSGTIKIDKPLYDNGIIKAEFDFKFKNTLEPSEALFWKGKIYSKINPD